MASESELVLLGREWGEVLGQACGDEMEDGGEVTAEKATLVGYRALGRESKRKSPGCHGGEQEQ